MLSPEQQRPAGIEINPKDIENRNIEPLLDYQSRVDPDGGGFIPDYPDDVKAEEMM